MGAAIDAAFGSVRMGAVYGPVIGAPLGFITGIILYISKSPDKDV